MLRCFAIDRLSAVSLSLPDVPDKPPAEFRDGRPDPRRTILLGRRNSGRAKEGVELGFSDPLGAVSTGNGRCAVIRALPMVSIHDGQADRRGMPATRSKAARAGPCRYPDAA